jgi:hypothetical protein
MLKPSHIRKGQASPHYLVTNSLESVSCYPSAPQVNVTSAHGKSAFNTRGLKTDVPERKTANKSLITFLRHFFSGVSTHSLTII